MRCRRKFFFDCIEASASARCCCGQYDRDVMFTLVHCCYQPIGLVTVATGLLAWLAEDTGCCIGSGYYLPGLQLSCIHYAKICLLFAAAAVTVVAVDADCFDLTSLQRGLWAVALARHTFAYWPWGLVAACPCLSTAPRPGYLDYAVNCMHVGEHACGLACSVSYVNGLPAVCIRCVSLLCYY